MPADIATSNDPVREPSVGVVGSGPLERRLIAVLKRDGLDAGPAVSARRSRTPDVLVLVVDSLSTAKSDIGAARDGAPGAQLVVVVGSATPAEARQLLVDDVRGLVLEESIEAALALAARAAVAGQICYPAALMPTHLKAALSTREKQILGMLVLGFRNAEIAAKLHVSESTVKSHLNSAFTTLGVRTRKEAVALILDPEAGFGTGILAITNSGPR